MASDSISAAAGGDPQSLLLAVLEAAPDALFGIDPDGRIVFANAQASEMFGRDRAQLLTMGVEDLLPVGLREAHPAHRAAFARDPRPRPMGTGLDLKAQRADGSTFPVEISLSPLATPGGPLVLAAVRDVTERKRIEESFTAVLEAAPDALFGVDAEGAITFANAQATHVFGYQRGELIGRRIEDLLPDDVRAAHPSRRAAFARDPGPRPMGTGLDLRAKRADGSTFPVEISLSPLETPAGPLVLAAVRDVTERKRIEASLSDTRRELELREAREAQALEVNDNIVQGLSVAKYSLEAGAAEGARQAIDETLRKAQQIITDLLGDDANSIEISPGALRRAQAARLREHD